MPRPLSLKRLEREMEARYWTNADLARASGVAREIISRIRTRGHVASPRTIQRLAKAFAENPPPAVIDLSDEVPV